MSGAPRAVVRALVVALALTAVVAVLLPAGLLGSASAATTPTPVPSAAASVSVTAAPTPAASPGVVLAADDAADLAQQLADATAVQGICYGWDVQVFDASGPDGGIDVGSSGGPGVPVDEAPGCARVVELHATITYTSASSETEDHASWYVSDTLDHPLLLNSQLPDADGLVDDSTGDVALYNAVAQLPLLVAEAGAAPYVTPEPALATPVPGVALTGHPGSDWWRTKGPVIGVFLFMIAAGGAWAWWVWRKEPTAPDGEAPRRHHSRTARSRPAGSRSAQTRRLP